MRSTLLIITMMMITPALLQASETVMSLIPASSTDARPDFAWAVHRTGNLNSALSNYGYWADPNGDSLSMEWPDASGNNYLWNGDFWSCCYGSITASATVDRYASCSDYSNWELSPSEGYPMLYETPGGIAPEQSEYGADDWDSSMNDDPYGLGVLVQNYTWSTPGYDNFIADHLVITHHSEHGNPGVPLEGLLVGIRGDCDVASADQTECHLDDMVYYDGHAIWCNDPAATFEYVFDDGDPASTQDDYIYQQNPDNPLPSGNPDNIYYYYNYPGSDGIPDNDVDQNGVSDQFTILAKVAGGDTLYLTDPQSGVTLFQQGMPENHFCHTVGDTTYLVVPRNLSYMWDSDDPGSTEDDSGEPDITPYCNGFIGWRLLDVWVDKAGGGIERPCDVYGCPIPISHCWWNWENDPGSDQEKYAFMWGINPDSSGIHSGPEYMSDWVGNPNTPDAMDPANPGPFPFVCDEPLNLEQPVFDYRFLQSIGPVDLEDGDTLHVVGGWVMGLGLDGLRMNADLLLSAYCNGSIWQPGLGVERSDPLYHRTIAVSPNPVASMASVDFTLTQPGRVVAGVYDLSGRRIELLSDSDMDEGPHSIAFGTDDYRAGVYFVGIESGAGISTGRFVVLR